MVYNFDEIIERRGSHCVKHDWMVRDFGTNDLLPMWVADMDFRTPDFIMEAIRQRCDHEVMGYAVPSDGYCQAVQNWLSKRYHINTELDELHFIPGIVAGIAFVLQCMTQPGDRILVLNPVYPPFLNLPQTGGRVLECSPMQVVDGRFSINYEDLEQRAKKCRLMILSNPHNPGGTVWRPDELQRIAEICQRHGLTVIADEIHADLTLPGYKHTSYSTVCDAARQHSITFIAPSKTFNIAGLSSSIAYVPNATLREKLFGYLDGYELANGNIFAFVGAEAAFSRQGEEWLDQLLHYLAGNVAFLQSFLRERMPQVDVVLPEASFLPWLDFRYLGNWDGSPIRSARRGNWDGSPIRSARRIGEPSRFPHEECRKRLIEKARVALNDGTTFGGDAYRCCFRLNIGCPRETLKQALEQIAEAFS